MLVSEKLDDFETSLKWNDPVYQITSTRMFLK